MTLRAIIDAAVADAMAEHPKYFTPKGHEHARTVIVRKIMAAFRGDGSDKPDDTAADHPASPQPLLVEPHSREAIAFSNLRQIAGATTPFRLGDGRLSINAEAACPAVFALADLPLKSQWLFLTAPRNVGAWQEFFRDTLPGVARRPIHEHRGTEVGLLMPWPWPPTKDGKVYVDDAEHAA